MSAAPPNGRLSRREAAFVACYLANGGEAAAAARDAGYSAKTAKEMGYELKQRPRVAAAIAAGEAEAAARLAAVNERVIETAATTAERTAVERQYVLDNLREIVERCMQRAPVMVRRGREMVQATDEEDRHVWTFNAKPAVAALQLLGKEHGMFRERVEHSGPDGGSIEVIVTRRIIRPPAEPSA